MPSRATRHVRLWLGASMVAALLTASGCGEDSEPAFCQQARDAMASFKGTDARSAAAMFTTLASQAPRDLRDDLQAMVRMFEHPKKFNQIAYRRHMHTITVWLDSNCHE